VGVWGGPFFRGLAQEVLRLRKGPASQK